jgi:hypothetical protein
MIPENPIRSDLLENKRVTYKVRLKILDKILGGTPHSLEYIENWAKARGLNEHSSKALIHEVIEDMSPLQNGDPATLKEPQVQQAVEIKLMDAAHNGFRSKKDRGLFIGGYQVKALLKESANIIKQITQMTNLKSRVAERMFVLEDYIFLGKFKEDGTEEGPISVMTPRGPRSAFKRVDYVEQVEIEFRVECLDEKYVSKTKEKVEPYRMLLALLDYGRRLGLGAGRSQGNGWYEILEITQVENE